MAKRTSEKPQRGVSRRQKVRCSLTVPKSTARSAAPSSLRNIHAVASPGWAHKTFRRSYREDYVRELEVPGVGQQIFRSFKIIFTSWRVFLPLFIITVILAVGLMGLPEALDMEVGILSSMIFLVIWLTTIYIVRQKMAGVNVGIREALYNAMAPLISTLVILVIALVQSLPIMILIVAYDAAIETNFLSTPFYAFLFLGFAILMILLSGYLLSSTLIAMVAVSAPGLYPMEAMRAASDLMAGRRMRFLFRLVALLTVLLVIWGIIIGPLVAFSAPGQVISIFSIILACFSSIYAAVYLYLFYRYMIE